MTDGGKSSEIRAKQGAGLLASAMEAWTGARKEGLAGVARLIRDAAGGDFLSSLKTQFERWRMAGKVQDSFFESRLGQTTLAEIVDDLEKEIPDEIRLGLLRKALLATAAVASNELDDILKLQFVRMCRKLTAEEVLVMLCSYHNRDVEHDQHKGRDGQWLQLAATETGLKFLEQVKRVDQLLAAKGLFLKATHAGGAGMICRPGWGRLTDFGLALCRFLENGE